MMSYIFYLKKKKGLPLSSSPGHRISQLTPLEEIFESGEEVEPDGDTVSSGTIDLGLIKAK